MLVRTRYRFFLFLISTFLLCSCPMVGQEPQKRDLKEADYGKWGTLWTKGLSNLGNWVSFEMTYENHNDTLFLKRTTGNKTYTFPKGKNGQCGVEQVFACLLPNAVLQVTELRSGKMQLFPDVKRYDLLVGGKYILTSNKGRNTISLIKIRNQKGAVIDSISNVTDYVLNPKKNGMLFAVTNGSQHSIGIMNFEDRSKRIITQSKGGSFYQLTWQANGKSAAYLLETDTVAKTKVIQQYRIADQQLFTFDAQKTAGFKDGFAIYDRFKLSLSESGSQVFFWAALRSLSELKKEYNRTEVWNGTDKQIYPSQQFETSEGELPKLACWYPEKNQFRMVSSDALPQKRLSPKRDYALLSNAYCYGLENTYYENVDYYLKDIWTGKEKLLLEHQSHDPNQIGFSAFGNTIIYYRNKNWWIYDIDAGSHRNMTQGIVTNWDNSGTNAPHQFGVYGNPGWSADGKSVLLYDEFDIWCVALDGSNFRRLTAGREQQTSFRIAAVENAGFKIADYEGRNPYVYDLSKDLLLEAQRQTDYASGYYLLTSGTKVQKLVFEASKITDLLKSEKGSYVYTKQRFDQSPKLLFLSDNHRSPNLLFESNKQQKNYYYGSSALIACKNSKGEPLKGALFYPAHYDAAKQYPMVVNIYDALSKHIYDYANPSLVNAEGFNITNFTLNGYFVLLPDINYQLGNPGISAVDCVTAGVTAIIEKGIVAKDKIGLIGHSFGGYETNFIITQSALFAAAVSGAGISDPIALYFNIGQNRNMLSDMWRFESQQWRMGKSLYADKEGYLRNSPIMHADKIKTPLLLWAGKKDQIVPMHQSVAFYLALRRLRVKNIFLGYPEEEHSIENPVNQMDLTHRVQQWFDYFLKGKTDEEWISKGTSFD